MGRCLPISNIPTPPHDPDAIDLRPASTAKWNPREQKLTLVVVNPPGTVGRDTISSGPSTGKQRRNTKALGIPQGSEIRFFLEHDQGFVAPYYTYDMDPSFRISVPRAGIAEDRFLKSPLIGSIEEDSKKAFTFSKLVYGDFQGDTAHPGYPMTVRLEFEANVMITQGTVIRLHLPGFRCCMHTTTGAGGKTELEKRSTAVVYDDSKNLHGAFEGTANWNLDGGYMDFGLKPGKRLKRGGRYALVITSSMEKPVIYLPDFRLVENDSRLKLEAVGSVYIHSRPVQKSPQVVDRSFFFSQLQFAPAIARWTTKITFTFRATVPIGAMNPIVLRLPGFSNSKAVGISGTGGRTPGSTERQSLLNDLGLTLAGSAGASAGANNPTATVGIPIQLTGMSAGLVADAHASWDPYVHELIIPLVRERNTPGIPILPNTTFEISIEESQGFSLPAALTPNDPSLQVRSGGNNIRWQSIQSSPMVGNGPFLGQRWCFRQFERGTRTIESRVALCSGKNPGSTSMLGGGTSGTAKNECELIRDPCDVNLLERCGCRFKVIENAEDSTKPQAALPPLPVTVQGFQLTLFDKIGFVPLKERCPRMPQEFVTAVRKAQTEVAQRNAGGDFGEAAVRTGDLVVINQGRRLQNTGSEVLALKEESQVPPTSPVTVQEPMDYNSDDAGNGVALRTGANSGLELGGMPKDNVDSGIFGSQFHPAFVDYNPFINQRLFEVGTAATQTNHPASHSDEEDDDTPSVYHHQQIKTLSRGLDSVSFTDVAGKHSGFYRVCFQHYDEVIDVGLAIVRPLCEQGQVSLDSMICVKNCPTGKIPVAGGCENLVNITATGTGSGGIRPGHMLEPVSKRVDPAFYLGASESELEISSLSVPGFVDPAAAEEALKMKAAYIANQDLLAGETLTSVDGKAPSEDADSVVAANVDASARDAFHRNPYRDESLIKKASTPAGSSLTPNEDEHEIFQPTSGPLLVSMRMRHHGAIAQSLWNKTHEDPEKVYFMRRFQWELGAVLGLVNEASGDMGEGDRIQVVSVTEDFF